MRIDATSRREFVGTAEAAIITGLSRRTVARMCGRGDVKAVKMGRAWLINRSALMAALGLNTDKPGAADMKAAWVGTPTIGGR